MRLLLRRGPVGESRRRLGGRTGAESYTAARRLGYVREAAGDRFAGLDIESSPYYAEITPDKDAAFAKIAATLRTTPEVIAEHPNVLVGTAEEVADILLARREVTGINYVTVPQGLIESFAPVAARLNGK